MSHRATAQPPNPAPVSLAPAAPASSAVATISSSSAGAHLVVVPETRSCDRTMKITDGARGAGRAEQVEPFANSEDDVAVRTRGIAAGRARDAGAAGALRPGEARCLVDGDEEWIPPAVEPSFSFIGLPHVIGGLASIEQPVRSGPLSVTRNSRSGPPPPDAPPLGFANIMSRRQHVEAAARASITGATVDMSHRATAQPPNPAPVSAPAAPASSASRRSRPAPRCSPRSRPGDSRATAP